MIYNTNRIEDENIDSLIENTNKLINYYNKEFDLLEEGVMLEAVDSATLFERIRSTIKNIIEKIKEFLSMIIKKIKEKVFNFSINMNKVNTTHEDRYIDTIDFDKILNEVDKSTRFFDGFEDIARDCANGRYDNSDVTKVIENMVGVPINLGDNIFNEEYKNEHFNFDKNKKIKAIQVTDYMGDILNKIKNVHKNVEGHGKKTTRRIESLFETVLTKNEIDRIIRIKGTEAGVALVRKRIDPINYIINLIRPLAAMISSVMIKLLDNGSEVLEKAKTKYDEPKNESYLAAYLNNVELV